MKPNPVRQAVADDLLVQFTRDLASRPAPVCIECGTTEGLIISRLAGAGPQVMCGRCRMNHARLFTYPAPVTVRTQAANVPAGKRAS